MGIGQTMVAVVTFILSWLNIHTVHNKIISIKRKRKGWSQMGLMKTKYAWWKRFKHGDSPCKGLTMLSWPTMVNHGSTLVGNVTAGDTDHGYWKYMVMPWQCFYPFNGNILTKKCLKLSVGDLSYVTFCFSLIKNFACSS